MSNPRPLRVINKTSSLRELALVTKEILSYGWAQGFMYNDEATNSYDDAVECMCTMGGACRACAPDAPFDIRSRFYAAIKRKTGVDVEAWNDNPNTKKEDVLRVLQEIADENP